MSQNLTCPSCGAAIALRSGLSLYTVCAYCQSMLVLHGTDLENLGKMASLPPDMSPMQLGVSGKFKNLSFTVIGRLKWAWERGFWTEWFLGTNDGQEAWLAEAQGEWMLTRLVPAPKKTDLNVAVIRPNMQVKLETDSYKVIDIKTVTCRGSEGELPFPSPKGYTTKIIDATSALNKFLSIDVGETEPRFYVGQYVTLKELNLQGLKTFEGWT